VLLHHVELWVADLGRAAPQWGWLLERLGCEPYRNWPAGRSWRTGETYVVVEQSPALRPDTAHDRYPHAGGPDHCAAYLENEDGFEVELVVGGR